MEELIKIAIALIGAISAVTGIYQWAAMRHRNKLKADLEILEKLRATSIQSLENERLRVKTADVTAHIGRKLEEQYASLRPEERYDPNGSRFFIGLILIVAAFCCWNIMLRGEPTPASIRSVDSLSTEAHTYLAWIKAQQGSTKPPPEPADSAKQTSNTAIIAAGRKQIAAILSGKDDTVLAVQLATASGSKVTPERLREIHRRLRIRRHLLGWEVPIGIALLWMLLHGIYLALIDAPFRCYRFLFSKAFGGIPFATRLKILAGLISRTQAAEIIRSRPEGRSRQ